MRAPQKLSRRLVIFGLMLAGLASTGHGLYLLSKAALAQVLLRRAWLARDHTPPWSGADTWPVARLVAPRQGVDLIVLRGASGSALAFGPAWLETTAPPGSSGHCVLAGHRDTHFRFLKDLADGELLTLEVADRHQHHYRIRSRKVVADNAVELLAPNAAAQLTLVTCYPFEGVTESHLRFLVQAEWVASGDAASTALLAPQKIWRETLRSIAR